MPPPERKCPDCGGLQFVEDHAQGDIVCKGCGLVVEAHIIDERSEWRTFSDKDKDNGDPNRVGGPNNPLLEGGGLTTMIAKGPDGGAFNLTRMHARNNNPDKALQNAFRILGDLADRLRLNNGLVKTTACELYKQATESGRLRGRSTMAICAACMFMACRQNNTPRSFKEITSLMPAQVRKKDISACFKEVLALMKDLGKDRDMGTQAHMAPVAQHPADYMRRFAGELRLGHEMSNALREMALAAKPKDEGVDAEVHPWDSRSPLSVAAAIVWILTSIKDPVPMQDVCTVTNVAEVTIRSVYRDMYPHLRKLLPPGFNSPEQLARLPTPDGRSNPTAGTNYAAAYRAQQLQQQPGPLQGAGLQQVPPTGGIPQRPIPAPPPPVAAPPLPAVHRPMQALVPPQLAAQIQAQLLAQQQQQQQQQRAAPPLQPTLKG